MKQKKPTPKKKSAPSSLLLTKQREGALVAFDMVGVTFVGEVVEERNDFIVLRHPGALSFRPEALPGGQQFKLKASLTHRSPYTELYYLSRAGIRGMSFIEDATLLGLYQAFVERAERGDFNLNPYALPETKDLVQKSQDPNPEIDAATLNALPAPDDKEKIANGQQH